jgi:hypothetical protein
MGQDYYEKFIEALIMGDTILAKKISDDNTKVEQIKTRKFELKIFQNMCLISRALY